MKIGCRDDNLFFVYTEGGKKRGKTEELKNRAHLDSYPFLFFYIHPDGLDIDSITDESLFR